MHITTYGHLGLNCLTPEQRARTCDYWYTVTSRNAAYTAFRTREALDFFLDLHGIAISSPIPRDYGTWAHIPLVGETRQVMHGDSAQMPASGRRVLHMSNGDYTLGIAVPDDKGVVIHFVGPSAERVVFHHGLARAFQDAGHKGSIPAGFENLG